jgi:hypothetical protein
LKVTVSVPPAPPAKLPMTVPPKRDVAARDADLARAGALVADRHRVLGQEAGERQRAAVEVVVGVGEGDVRVDDLRRAVDRVLEKGDRRGEAGGVGTEFAMDRSSLRMRGCTKADRDGRTAPSARQKPLGRHEERGVAVLPLCLGREQALPRREPHSAVEAT